MLRAFLCSAAVLALCVGSLVAADKGTKGGKGKHKARATITKVDAKNGTVTVRMKGKDGKTVTKDFKLTEEVRYIDSTGRVAAADIFQNGDQVLVIEEEGQLKELHKAKKKGDKNSGKTETSKSGK